MAEYRSEEGAAYAAEALKWTGTPFRHHQSCRGFGTDCVGLAYGAGKAIGLLPADFRPPVYSQQWHVHKNEELLLDGFKSLGFFKIPEPIVGCLLSFRFGRVSSHVGIYTGEGRFVHAYFSLQRVVEQPLSGDLAARVSGYWAGPWEAGRYNVK